MQPLNLPLLTLDGTSDRLEYDRAELEAFYLPLAQFLLAKMSPARRFVVGIAGPPAGGKSAFTQLLSAVCCALAGSPIAAAVGLDGWHFPNHYLDSHTLIHNGVEIPLRKVKGGPFSFDVAAVWEFLNQLRTQAEMAYPLYSRELHDPIPAAAQLTAQQRLILIEGNYILLDQPPWDAFESQFDLTIFLNTPSELLLQALRDRHLRGGKDPEAVEKHMQFSDTPNMDLILYHSKPASIRIEKSGARHILRIGYPPE